MMQAALQKAGQVLAQVKLPTLPQEVLQLREELTRRYPNTVTVANLIAHNPELLNDFLTLVNSSLKHTEEAIKDAKAAVNLLGLDDLYNIFLAAAFAKRIAESPEEREILLHGAKTGIAAAEIAYWVEGVTRSEAYLIGLTQNIGALYLFRVFQTPYLTVFNNQLANPFSGLDKELEQFETAHPYVGTLVARKWQIDPDLYKAMLLHHDADFVAKTAGHDKVRKLVALVMVSNYVVSSTLGETYITRELKRSRDLGMDVLKLPDNALRAARAAVMKWGSATTLVQASH